MLQKGVEYKIQWRYTNGWLQFISYVWYNEPLHSEDSNNGVRASAMKGYQKGYRRALLLGGWSMPLYEVKLAFRILSYNRIRSVFNTLSNGSGFVVPRGLDIKLISIENTLQI